MNNQLNVTIFVVEGLDCPSEEKLIRNQLQAEPGIEKMEFNFITSEVTIYHRLNNIALLQQKIAALGMNTREKGKTISNNDIKTDYFSSWWLIGLAGFLAILAEIVSYWSSTETSIWVLLLALSAMALSGPPTFKKGWLALRRRTMSINSLMMIAIIGAILIGEWPEAAMVTVLFALAERIERYSLDKARLAIRSLMQITPETALVKQDNGSWQQCLVEQIKVGAVVKVKPGERIPLDGAIISGQIGRASCRERVSSPV